MKYGSGRVETPTTVDLVHELVSMLFAKRGCEMGFSVKFQAGVARHTVVVS